MKNNKSCAEVFNQIYTVEDQKALFDQIDEAIEGLFRTKVKAEAKLSKILPYSKKQDLVKYCKEEGVDFKNPLAIKRLLENIKQELSEFQVLKMVLSYEPTESQVREIHEWIRSNTGKKIILDIEVNPKVIAGAALVYRGVYKDYSVKTMIERMYRDKNLVQN